MSDYLVFDDIDTRNLSNIYVFPNKVDDTPKRVYEVKNIAGRNGGLYVDQYRFEDVEHTYSIAALTKADGVDFINKLASKIGYFRLSDSFNPDEYYMAVFTSGAEVIMPSSRNKSVFEITFTRKPQRWLTSGETATTVANNGTLTNPTLFEAEPLLAVKGYGDVSFNGYTINLQNVQIGTTLLASSGIGSTVALDMDSMNTGDSFTVSGVTIRKSFVPSTTSYRARIESIGAGTNCTVSGTWTSAFNVIPNDKTFTKGTSGSLSFSIASSTIRVTKKSDWTYTDTSVTLSGSVAYDGSSTLTISLSVSPSSITNVEIHQSTTTPDIYGTSTMSALGNPTYIDCSIGECYMIKNSKIISLNSLISLGSDLPKLSTGTNTFTKDNTITELKVTPNWWQV